MQNRSARNNLLAGLFVVASLLLTVWVSMMLARRGAGIGATIFTIRFSLDDGAPGLQSGSPVTLGGQPVGSVLSVDFYRPTADDPGVAAAVDVKVEVRRDVTLYEDCKVFLERPLLGTLSSINITSAGTGALAAGRAHQGSSPRLENGEVIGASTAPPSFLAQAGLGPEPVQSVRDLITSAQRAVERIERLTDKGGPELESALSDARALLNDARGRFDQWSVRVDSTLTHVDQAAMRLTPLADKADSTLDSGRALFDEARATLRDNRERIDAIVADIQSAAHRFDKEGMTRLLDALREGGRAMSDAQLAVHDVRELLAQEGPQLRRTLANLRLMSDQLKLTSIEVRSRPWRLLHEPTTKELSTQALYDAARSYASAASDIRAAADAVDALARQSREGRAGPERSSALDTLIGQLADSMARFREAETRLLDTLITEETRR